MNELEKNILKNLDAFIGFARSKINDPELASDVVQDSLLKALQAANAPTAEEKIVPWFYQILRRSIIDLYRRNDARGRALQRFETEMSTHPNPADERVLCGCFRGLLPDLPRQYRSLIERVDLEGENLQEVAASLGIKTNNLNVRLFRARKQLRARLEQTCKACSKHGCLDCTCKKNQNENTVNHE